MTDSTTTLNRAEGLQKFAKMVKGIRFAMLTTVDEDGHLDARPMATQDSDFEGKLYFFTAEHSHKVTALKDNNQVNVAYADPSDNRYLSARGTARLVDDAAKKKELWNPMLKAWFPRGLEDPELALLCVDVEDAHFWDTPSGKMVQLFGMVKAAVTGEGYKPSKGETGHIDLQH